MRAFALLGALAVLVLGLCSTAGASIQTVGVPLTAGPVGSTAGSGITATLLNLIIAEPRANTVSPVSGVIVRWNLVGATGGPFRLRVLRPAAGEYTSVGTSAAAMATGPGVETFPTDLPVQAGDTVGLDVIEGQKVGAIPNPASKIGVILPIIVEGATKPLTETAVGAEFVFNAEVQPAPTVTSIAPGSGSFKGGASVKISGTDFTGVSAVSFGGVPAKSFTVNSETKLTAKVPARRKTGKVGVTVSTNAGTNPASPHATFSYKACTVPKLKGKTLKAAKKKAKKAGCKVGKVTKRAGADAKTGVVVKQGKNPGKKLAPGTGVDVTLGP